jgi:glycosyltransferase involved in cell wall biosynthesis
MMKKISIISPVYNGATFLPSFIKKLVEFTFQDFEIIFVDNNSSDDSVQILQTELSKTKLDYKILYESNQGSGYARNNGIKNAIGKYVTFIDCDDHIHPQKLKEDVRIMEEFDVDYVLCRTQRTYTDGRTLMQPLEGLEVGMIDPPKAGLIWLSNFFFLQGPGAILAKREVINFLGGFHTSKTGQDAFLYIRLGLYSKGYYYDKVYNFYLRHAASTISKRNKEKDGIVLSYFNLRKNLFSDDIVNDNSKAINILKRQLNGDLFRLHSSGYSLSELTKDSRLEKLELNVILFNKFSLFLNKIVPNIKYNPFYRIWLRIK